MFLVSGGRVSIRPVTTGISDENNIEIVKGIIEGDTLISGPFSVLRTINDGDEVEVERKER